MTLKHDNFHVTHTASWRPALACMVVPGVKPVSTESSRNMGRFNQRGIGAGPPR